MCRGALFFHRGLTGSGKNGAGRRGGGVLTFIHQTRVSPMYTFRITRKSARIRFSSEMTSTFYPLFARKRLRFWKLFATSCDAELRDTDKSRNVRALGNFHAPGISQTITIERYLIDFYLPCRLVHR